MKLSTLQYFVEVAEQKSMRKAADNLYNSQPNISRAIKILEDELDEVLLLRSNHGVELTKAGENVYFYAKSIIEQSNAIKRVKYEKHQLLQSKLNISVGNIFLPDSLIWTFFQQINSHHTSINIDETTVENTVNHVEKVKSELGIVVLNQDQMSAFKTTLELKDLEMVVVNQSPLCIHASTNNPLSSKETVRAKDLIDYTYLHFPFDFYTRINYSLNIDGFQLSDFKQTLTINNYHALIRMIQQTDSFIFGNMFQLGEMKKGNISTKIIENSNMDVFLVWIKRKKEILSQNAELFLKLFLDYYHKP